MATLTWGRVVSSLKITPLPEPWQEFLRPSTIIWAALWAVIAEIMKRYGKRLIVHLGLVMLDIVLILILPFERGQYASFRKRRLRSPDPNLRIVAEQPEQVHTHYLGLLHRKWVLDSALGNGHEFIQPLLLSLIADGNHPFRYHRMCVCAP